jgi:catechol 2,3-dioxygenase-like lactoylglutathione lyase family enzyme
MGINHPGSQEVKMAIVGVETAVFGVSDLERCKTFFDDLGLSLAEASDLHADYRLAEGSHVVVRALDDVTLPPPFSEGSGICQVIWGVDDQHALDLLESDLRSDREVVKGPDGTIYCKDDVGLSVGFRLFQRTALVSEKELINAPGRAERWNTHRKWFDRAKPQLIHHVVFGCAEFEKAALFYRDRLKFRITDVARSRGIFLRADGRSDHHNVFWMKSDQPRFVHISFGVENLDELLAGANHMQRQSWSSKLGLGRHRISSTIYFYVESPAGGEAEYSADTDCLDDRWEPRVWEPLFGNQHWVADLPEFLAKQPARDVRMLADEAPELAALPK